jgi:quercetin dioxygenase-like cupin family protein
MTLVELGPQKRLPSIRHERTHEWIYVTAGSGVARLSARRVRLKRGDYLYLPPRLWHSFAAGPKGLSAVSIYMPGFNWKRPDAEVREK